MEEHELMYKYSDWDKHLQDAIEKRYFWFSKPTNFNDSFDSNMDILTASEKSHEILKRLFIFE